jgi:hypothetical protein
MHKPKKTSNDQFFKVIDTMLSNPPKIANLGSNFELKIYILKVENLNFQKNPLRNKKNKIYLIAITFGCKKY